jgi:GNAT superfamily N-acetyltransferase
MGKKRQPTADPLVDNPGVWVYLLPFLKLCCDWQKETSMETATTAKAEGGYHLRAATAADLPVIMRHRRCMFSDMGFRDEASLDAMEATSAPFIRAGLESGCYRGWLVETADGVVAGGGVVTLGFPSSPRDPSPHRAYILNMYTEPEYRRRGLAKLVVEAMVRWCREEGFGWVSLHASDEGRSLYESLGFAPTNEMRLALK